MAYLSPHFENDVFVSYSHGDPRSASKPLKEWTVELVSKLEKHIVALDPEFTGLDIWWDKDLDPTLQLTPELKAKVKSSGILLIVTSPHYLGSRWCKGELTWFSEQIQDRVQDPERVFIVRAVRTDESKWPKFLRDERGFTQLGFGFHDPQNDEPYCWGGSTENINEYIRSLRTLRTILTKRLRDLHDRAQARVTRAEMQAAPRYIRNGPRRIYLHARTEDAPICLEVQDRLTEVGFNPAIDMTGPGEELRDWRRATKNRIEMAKGFDALALIRAKGDDELEAIAQARGAPLPCAVLDRSGEELPIDVSGWGVEHFDLHNNHWRGEFRQWLDKGAARPVAAPP